MKLLKFSMSGCAPCKMLTKTLEDVDLTNYELVEIDLTKHEAETRNIRGVPVLIIEKDGVEVKRVVGYQNAKQLTEFLAI